MILKNLTTQTHGLNNCQKVAKIIVYHVPQLPFSVTPVLSIHFYYTQGEQIRMIIGTSLKYQPLNHLAELDSEPRKRFVHFQALRPI